MKLVQLGVGNLGNDDVAVLQFRRLRENLLRIGIRLPFISPWFRTDLGWVGRPMQSRGNRHIHWDGFQLVNGLELMVKLTAQIAALNRVESAWPTQPGD